MIEGDPLIEGMSLIDGDGLIENEALSEGGSMVGANDVPDLCTGVKHNHSESRGHSCGDEPS